MEEYASNSYRSRDGKKEEQPERRVEKPVVTSAKLKKRSEIRKFADLFLPEDATNLKSYILLDVLIPSVKKTILDIANTVFWGGGAKKSSGSKVSYGQYYNGNTVETKRAGSRGGIDYDNIIFDTRGDAENVLDSMNDIISQYDVVSILDLYDLADVSTDNFALKNYGWDNIAGCRVVRTRDGYMLSLPKAKPIK